MTDLSEIEKLLQTAGKGRASAPRLKDGVVSLVLDVTGLGQVQREVLEAGIRGQLKSFKDVTDVRIAMTAEKKELRLIAVGSGKGGVGKSTLAAHLAIALKRLGVKVGLVDSSEEHTSELTSLMRISYAVFRLKTNKLANTH